MNNKNDAPQLTANPTPRLHPWPDLSDYHLRLFLLRAPDGAKYVLAGGDTETNSTALTDAGFRRHPQQGHWFRSFSSGSNLSVNGLRQAFPAVRMKLSDPATIVIGLRASVAREIAVEAAPVVAVEATPVFAVDIADSQPLSLMELRADVERSLLDVEASERSNYRLVDRSVLRTTWNDRGAVEGNLRALRVLNSLSEGAEASNEDLDALIGYVGWGGLPGVFADGHDLNNRYHGQLVTLVSDAAYREMKSSTMNAHYTNHRVIDAMWESVVKAGFTGGRVLEPGAGTGLFLAAVPEVLMGDTNFVAVEKDGTSARILNALYPAAKIFASGYEFAAIPDGSMDLVIGNVPFGAYGVYDPAYKKMKLMIHDYFVLKSLDKLRPGGLMMVITGTGTLDRQNPVIREAMYERGDLMAAYRLPNDTFRGNANTSVTADVMVVRKRLPGESPMPFDWRDVAPMEVSGGEGATTLINRVFSDLGSNRRGHILGNLVTQKNMYGSDRVAVTRDRSMANNDAGFKSLLATIPATMPTNIYVPTTVLRDVAPSDADRNLASDGMALSRFFDPRAEGMFVATGTSVGVVFHGKTTPISGLTTKNQQRIRDYIVLRDALGGVLQAQIDGVEDVELRAMQEALGTHYDAFVAANGRIADGRRNQNRRLLEDDPLFDAVHALEVLDDDNRFVAKADVFSTRTIGKTGVAVCHNATDALFACIDEHGKVIAEVVERYAAKPWAVCFAELNAAHLVFLDPSSGEPVLGMLYLSGNVRQKLVVATVASLSDERFASNAAALKDRLPRWKTHDEIDLSLGMPWIPKEDIAAFVRELYDDADLDVDVVHNDSKAEWAVNIIARFARAPRWDTPRMSAGDLVESALNGKTPKITKPVIGEEKKREVDEVNTAITIEKQKAIKAFFKIWAWTDVDRRERLETVYNNTFNAHRSADYKSIPMSISGMTVTRALRRHQVGGVVRGVLEDNVMLAHPVGFGKTATMAAIALKLKQLSGGKTLVVTPKNVMYQFAAEIVRWFPTSKVLTVKSEDFTPMGRQRFWRRVQVSSPDVIVTTPEAFKRLRIPKDIEERFLMEEIERAEQAINNAADNKNTREVKTGQRALAGKVAQLQKLLNTDEKDVSRVTLGELGVTTLIVDEAHRFKSLQVDSSETILGIPSSASQRAFDMLSKVRYLQSIGGKVIFGTGSMITNTLAEVYNMQRYLQPDVLDAAGVGHFDAWRAQFANTLQSLEPDPAGKGYRIVVRLAQMQNVPELVKLLAQFTDAVADDDTYFVRPTPTFDTVSVPPTPLQEAMRASLATRVQEIRERSGGRSQKGEDNILVVLGDSRRSALDVRTLYPQLPRGVGGSKIEAVAKNAHAIYVTSAANKGTQAIFLDIGTPKPKGDVASFNAYEELSAAMVELGIPRHEIAFIHDAKSDNDKLTLFRRVREGNVRVIIGSTEKMGEGSNIQDRLVHLHHMNAPFHPGAVVQRNGRIIRDGNQFTKVGITTYVTKGLLEDWNWHLVTLKAKFIRAVMDGLADGSDGENLARSIVEDGETSMSYDEIEAEASNNPLVRQKCLVDSAVRRLELLASGWGQQRGSQRSRVNHLGELIRMDESILATVRPIQQIVEAHRRQRAEATQSITVPKTVVGAATPSPVVAPADKDLFHVVVGDYEYTDRTKGGSALLLAAQNAFKSQSYQSQFTLGSLDGLNIVMLKSLSGSAMPPVFVVTDGAHSVREFLPHVDLSTSPSGMMIRLENAVAKTLAMVASSEAAIERRQIEMAKLQIELDAEWPNTAELGALREQQSAINIALAQSNDCEEVDGNMLLSQELAKYGIAYGATNAGFDDFDAEAARAELGFTDNDDANQTSDDETDADDGQPPSATIIEMNPVAPHGDDSAADGQAGTDAFSDWQRDDLPMAASAVKRPQMS